MKNKQHMGENLNKERIAFTLAEVLIVMNVIGTVAAMTLPTIVRDVQEQVCIAGLQKAYSTFSQATNMIAAEKGGSPDAWGVETDAEFYDLYSEKLNLAKNCREAQGCFTSAPILSFDGSKTVTNWSTFTGGYRMLLTNGMGIMLNGAKYKFVSNYYGTIK